MYLFGVLHAREGKAQSGINCFETSSVAVTVTVKKPPQQQNESPPQPLTKELTAIPEVETRML